MSVCLSVPYTAKAHKHSAQHWPDAALIFISHGEGRGCMWRGVSALACALRCPDSLAPGTTPLGPLNPDPLASISSEASPRHPPPILQARAVAQVPKASSGWTQGHAPSFYPTLPGATRGRCVSQSLRCFQSYLVAVLSQLSRAGQAVQRPQVCVAKGAGSSSVSPASHRAYLPGSPWTCLPHTH